MPELRIPLATYRLQFNHLFSFKQAQEILDYLNELGITDLYASPLMKSRRGSLHGYDVLDPSQLNPEIGSEADLKKMAEQIKESQMGLLLDIVPNHTSIGDSGNKWWEDVLENGPSSIYAKFFNIIWNPPKPELKNRVLLPVLDQQYGKVIENQEFRIIYDAGGFYIEYKEFRFPLNPQTWTAFLNPAIEKLLPILGENAFALIELQNIVTALEHLPPITETDLEKCKERMGEKEGIKTRLAALLTEFPQVKEAVNNSMKTLNGEKGNPHSFDCLENLLDAQAYRLSFWRASNEEINYRRFFDVNSLVCMNVENQEVFDAMHAYVLEFVKKGWVTGLRIDHVDGLYDPQEYYERLQLAITNQTETSGKGFYLIVEKILGHGEEVRESWPVFGTTGYEFLNLLNGLYVFKQNKSQMKQIYEEFVDIKENNEELFYQCKKLILEISMSSELHILSKNLEEICEQNRCSRDFTPETLRCALRDIIAYFPLYRSYLRPGVENPWDEDRRSIMKAILMAKWRNRVNDLSVFDFIQSILLDDESLDLPPEKWEKRKNFIMHFQQLTAPVTAKGIEDTALYRFYPLASLNEVGSDASQFGTEIDFFHKMNLERSKKWPHTLLATSTHDTKRSEDTRARINVLSENPEGWKEALKVWSTLNHQAKDTLENHDVPGNNEEFFIYQTLIGTWPLDLLNNSNRIDYSDRIKKYIVKSLKEAKLHTSWINPNIHYEEAVERFIERLINLDSDNPFIHHFEKFIKPVMRAGLFNSLSQTLLKMTVPGIPDFYQGSELWEFNLVDPDNRRAVDYSIRQSILSNLKEREGQDEFLLLSHLVDTLEDGRIKLYLISKVLNYRKEHPALFQSGDYSPLVIEGEKANYALGFKRSFDKKQILVVTGRFFFKLCDSEAIQPMGNKWGNTVIRLSRELEGDYKDVVSGKITSSINRQLPLQKLFSPLPFALMEKI